MAQNLSTYNQALSLLLERFPMLGLLTTQWTQKNVQEEKLPAWNIDKAELLYVYGLGVGEAFIACKDWLKDKNRKLVFLEDEPGIILNFLHKPLAIELLSHPQVHLELFSKKKKEIDALAAKFPIQRVEVVALPAKGTFKTLRLSLLRKTALSSALHFDRLYGFQPFSNFLKNLEHMPFSFYANKLQGAFANTPAIICGAGPSLEKSIPILKRLENKALLIAGGSTLAALSSSGVMPHFGMAIDPNLEEYRRFKNSFAFDVPLLYSTRVHPAVFQTCNGPFGYMRSGIGGAIELWLEEELGFKKDPLIGKLLPPESISVTTICIALAQFLGCNPIILTGIDMAYTDHKRYASGVMEQKAVEWEAIDAEKSAADRIIRRKDRLGNSTYTAVRWVMESESIARFAKKHKQIRFINATDGGIGFRGIDYVPLEKAVEGFKTRPLRKQVEEAIGKARMPVITEKIINTKIEEIRCSLDRLVGHLEVLAGEKKGSCALAELEMQEEIAYLVLFYDIYQVLKVDDFFWKNFLDLAKEYQKNQKPSKLS